MRHKATSLPAHLSEFEFTAAESGRSAPQVLDKCTGILQHNRGKSRSPVQGARGILCVDLCTWQKSTALKCTVPESTEAVEGATWGGGTLGRPVSGATAGTIWETIRELYRIYGTTHNSHLLTGFTEGLLQLSIAIWIMNYPILMPFAANRQVGGEGGFREGGQGGRL